MKKKVLPLEDADMRYLIICTLLLIVGCQKTMEDFSGVSEKEGNPDYQYEANQNVPK